MRLCSTTYAPIGVPVLLTALLSAVLALTPLAAPARPAATPHPYADIFDVATFNVLGSQHTAGSTKYAPGTVRARLTAQVIKRRKLQIVSMQEVQLDQLEVLTQRLPGYRLWPGQDLGGAGVHLQIAFSRRRFDLEASGSVKVPFDHQIRPVPWVLLRNKRNHRGFYVLDIHNSPQGQTEERATAVRREIALVHRLRATGRGVFLLGDANSRRTFYCAMLAGTSLHSASGGTAASVDDCHPPDGPLEFDWLLATPPFVFSDYRVADDDLIDRISDHPLVRARVGV